MRWKAPRVGDERSREFFAWFPVTLCGQTRWLERVNVKYLAYPDGVKNPNPDRIYDNYYPGYPVIWKPVAFLNLGDVVTA